jgi:3-isopropylmalate/(R)-2-methylmalate dehydratase large subunit
MGKTMSEKILAHAAGVAEASAGDILWVNIDKAMMDDILGPRVEIAEKMREIKDRVWNKGKVVIISDHYTPPASIKQAEIVKFTRDWAESHEIENYYEFVGPCHQVMAEYGHVLPGSIVLGTDSHTCMGGALGAFASGVGSTEMLGILITGKTWLRVPETIQVKWQGKLPDGVMAKDMSLKTIGEIGHAGATYKAVEYVGDAIQALALDERMAITNMAVEMGAKVGLMVPDDKVIDYLNQRKVAGDYTLYKSDDDANFCAAYDFSANKLTPVVACPHEVDNVTEIANVKGITIHQAYVGSCTGGRYNDLAVAARILKGRKVKKGVRLLVSPASQEIWQRASADGLLTMLAAAGATILAPTCGVCVGLHSGLLADGEACISSTNRNFIGRMGSKNANIYLGSPMVAAASAITGSITDPREFL